MIARSLPRRLQQQVRGFLRRLRQAGMVDQKKTQTMDGRQIAAIGGEPQKPCFRGKIREPGQGSLASNMRQEKFCFRVVLFHA